ncbi:MAG: DNA-protecting protein DprA [Desulfobacterales bacterium]|nr:DNA-protecting protein DprA [Desulfobacterales bacterium]
MNEILWWFTLKSTPGIGNCLFKRLIKHFGSPKNVIEASIEELMNVKGLSYAVSCNIKKYKIPEELKEEINIAQKKGYRIITMNEADYPALLLEIPDPPPFLYVYGDIPDTSTSIAIVGSRNATEYGLSTAKKLAKDLAAHNIVVISGMARGIDASAHISSITNQGKTLAVLGSGFEHIYPYEHTELFHQIAKNGAVISEFYLNTKPNSYNFPVRNRIISGISLGTIVIEASLKSGALITARLALEQGREVFAVPGSINSFKSTGAHNLLKQGAKLVETVNDILDEIIYLQQNKFYQNKNKKNVIQKENNLSSDETIVFSSLEPYPLHIDNIADKLSMEVSKVLGVLLTLELKGIVSQLPGTFFKLNEE